MNDDLDSYLNTLQDKLDAEARARYGEDGFERATSGRHSGQLDNPDAVARLTGQCGDSILMQFAIRDGMIARGVYWTDGCASSSICASMVVELALGRSVEEACAIEPASVLAALGRFPEEDNHCAYLATETLQTALHEWQGSQAGS